MALLGIWHHPRLVFGTRAGTRAGTVRVLVRVLLVVARGGRGPSVGLELDGCGGSLFWPKHFAEARPKKSDLEHAGKKGHGGPPAEWPPAPGERRENLKCYEAVERGAVADSRKNLIGNGRGLLSGRTGELLTQTLSCEPLNCRRMAAKCSFPRPPPTSSRV